MFNLSMPLSTYIVCIVMLFLGQALQILWIKIPSLKSKSAASNVPFSFKAFIKSDWHLMAGTLVLGAMAILGLDQIFHWKPEIINTVKWFFAGIGAFGSTVVLSKFSTFEKTLTSVLSVKANIADAATGGTITLQETIDAGKIVTGNDNIENESA